MLSRGNLICKQCHKKQVSARRKYTPKGTSTLGKKSVKKRSNSVVSKKELALAMIREGLTGAEVAKRVGVSPSTLSQWRKAAGLPGKRGGRAKNQPHHSTKPHTIEAKEEALRMFREGVKLREIENQLGIPYQTIYAWTRKSKQSTKSTKTNNQTPGKSTWANPGKREKAIRLLREGTTQKEIRKTLGVNKKSLNKWMIEEGLKTQKSPPKNLPLDEALQVILDESASEKLSNENITLDDLLGTWSISGAAMNFRITKSQSKQPNLIAWSRKSEENYIISDIDFELNQEHLGGKSLIQFQSIWPPRDWKTEWKCSPILDDGNVNRMECELVSQGGHYRKTTATRILDKEMIGNDSGYRCPKCGKISTNKGSMTIHIRYCKDDANELSKKVQPQKNFLREEAIQQIRDGLTGAEVARRLGVNRDTVRRWRKSAGLSGKSRGTKSALKEEALQMIRDGLSGAEAARRLGVHQGTVSKWRKSAGLSGVDGRKFHDIEKENDVIDLLREGKSFNQITKSTGVGRNAIIRIKKEAEREGFL